VKKVAIYCRVSSEDQKDRDTIENQIETLNTYIEFKDDIEKVNDYLDDGISGTIPFSERPAGKKLLEDAKKGLFEAILVYRIDRFGRDTLTGLSTVELLRQHNIEIISITEPFDLNTPTGRFQFITYLNMAELERNNILERMFIGATRAAKQGKWLGGIVPYGYFVNKEKYLEINEEEAKIVKKIFDLYINERLSSLDIAVFLNSTGIDCNYAARGTGKRNATEKKSLWSTSTIQRILSSTTYMGIHEYGKRSTKRKETIIREVPAIISKEVFEKAAQIRKENIKFSQRNSPNRVFLLRTLIKCSQCGRTYYGIYYKNKSPVYSCSGKKPYAKKLYGIKCNNLNVNADEIENYIWETCKNIMYNFDNYIIKTNTIDIEKFKNELNNLENRLSDLEKEKHNLLKLFRKEIISENELEDQLKDIKIEAEKYKKLINATNKKIEIQNNKENIINSYKNKIEYYKNNLENLNDEDKMTAIRMLVKEIKIEEIIHEGERIPSVNILWNMSNLLFKPSSVQRLSLTNTKKNPTLYIGKNLYIYYGKKIKELRLKNHLSKKELATALGISNVTLNSLEKGEIAKPYYYYYIYCRHFNIASYKYLNYFSINLTNYKDKIIFLQLYYGLKKLKELDKILKLYAGCITDYLSRNRNKYIENIIDNEINKLKKK